ncbi:MAG: hypothetical protein ABIS68_05765, partial [Casimicrobiaceae bacterium]
IRQSTPCSPFYSDDDLVEIGNAKTISYRVLGANHPKRTALRHALHLAICARLGAVLSTADARMADAASANGLRVERIDR